VAVTELAGLAFGVAPLPVMHASAALAVVTMLGHLPVDAPASPVRLRLEWTLGQNCCPPEGWMAQQAQQWLLAFLGCSMGPSDGCGSQLAAVVYHS